MLTRQEPAREYASGVQSPTRSASDFVPRPSPIPLARNSRPQSTVRGGNKMSDDTPRIHVDSDWKAEAQAEKDRLAEQATAKEAAAGDAPTDPNAPPGAELPPADFKGLMGVLASQAIMGLGAYTDPKTGGVVIDLPGAKFAIDLLAILEEKTTGNISEEEAGELTNILNELRSRFVQIAQLVAQQAAAGVGPDGTPTGGNPGDIPNLRIEEP